MTYPEKYIESIVPAQAVLLEHGWRVHTIIDEGRFLLGAERDELNDRHQMGWRLELDCIEGLPDDARLGMDRTHAFIILNGFEELLRLAVKSPKEIARFWGANISRIKDTEFNRSGELCPDPICGGLCRKGHHYRSHGGVCIIHGCRYYYPKEA